MSAETSDSEWKTFDRLESKYINKSERFVLPHRNFQRQYAHIYAARLWALRPKLQTAAERQLGSGVPVCRWVNVIAEWLMFTLSCFCSVNTVVESCTGTTFVPIPNRPRGYYPHPHPVPTAFKILSPSSLIPSPCHPLYNCPHPLPVPINIPITSRTQTCLICLTYVKHLNC